MTIGAFGCTLDTAQTAWSTSGRPATLCKTLGKEEFIRLPLPAARTIDVHESILRSRLLALYELNSPVSLTACIQILQARYNYHLTLKWYEGANLGVKFVNIVSQYPL